MTVLGAELSASARDVPSIVSTHAEVAIAPSYGRTRVHENGPNAFEPFLACADGSIVSFRYSNGVVSWRSRIGAGDTHPVASWQTRCVDDESLLAEAEQALTEIKVQQGLSERHAAVLAALRIRLRGSAGMSLEAMLEAAEEPSTSLEEKLEQTERASKPSLDDLLSREPEKPDWPS